MVATGVLDQIADGKDRGLASGQCAPRTFFSDSTRPIEANPTSVSRIDSPGAPLKMTAPRQACDTIGRPSAVTHPSS